MSFFDSELVNDEMREIGELQECVYKNILKFPSMEDEQKIEHIDILQELLDKQKVLYTRLKLSDDPEAIELRNKIEESAVMMGMPRGLDMNIIFNNMTVVIQNMKEKIQRA